MWSVSQEACYPADDPLIHPSLAKVVYEPLMRYVVVCSCHVE